MIQTKISHFSYSISDQTLPFIYQPKSQAKVVKNYIYPMNSSQNGLTTGVQFGAANSYERL